AGAQTAAARDPLAQHFAVQGHSAGVDDRSGRSDVHREQDLDRVLSSSRDPDRGRTDVFRTRVPRLAQPQQDRTQSDDGQQRAQEEGTGSADDARRKGEGEVMSGTNAAETDTTRLGTSRASTPRANSAREISANIGEVLVSCRG